jgi:hypothetical protein
MLYYEWRAFVKTVMNLGDSTIILYEEYRKAAKI